MKRSIQTVALIMAIGLLTYCGRPNVNFPRFVQESLVVWSITESIDDVYNQAVASQPIGSQDVNVACPGGGSIHITGSTGQNGVGTYDLVYEFTNCPINYTDGYSSASFTLGGTLNYRNGAEGRSYESTELSIKGDMDYGFYSASIDNNCYFKASYVENATSRAQVGQLCDHAVTWSSFHQDCTF
jgi:hypothetical protein